MAQVARCLDGRGRRIVHCRGWHQSAGIRLFLAAGVHVFSDPRARARCSWQWFIISPTPAGRSPPAGFANTSARCCFRGWPFYSFPSLLLAPKIYHWLTLNPHDDRALSAKLPLFTWPGFCVASAVFFGIWWLLSSRLRYWSLRQDVTGDALCTRKMRFHSGWGILAFAATADVRADPLDEIAAIPVVLDDFRRLFLCLLRLDGAGHGLCHHGGFAAPARPEPACCTTTSFIISASCFSPSRCCKPTLNSRNTSSSGTATCRTKPSGIIIREHGSWWWVEHGFDFRPFLSAVHSAAARRM